MSTRQITSIVIPGMLFLLQGCTTGISNIHTRPSLNSELPDTDPALDHFIAWIPREDAQTATVAVALVQVKLGNAKGRTGKELCGGAWPMNGEVVDRVGPYPVLAPVTLGGYPAWYYRISHIPGFRGCAETASNDLYRNLKANLPQWITVKTAAVLKHGHGHRTAAASLLK
jgi:hypothetical protein